MTRADAQARALRAASRVTFTLGLFGCAEDVPDPTPEPAEEAQADEQAADAGAPEADAGEQRDLFVDAAVDPTLDAGPAVPPDAETAPVVADAEVGDGGVVCEIGDPEYAACCDAVNWDFDAGCMAWGPPVPPALLA
ncbi:MAG: hypothetical protein KC549_09490 [Myxococcales bacterium]|nr:hypothetical protein [Myxococcales bacterium]MCB9546935.1 hypothetical protein [Myxococcales bacterium]